MKNSRTKNAVLTMLTSGIAQFLTLVLTFVSRTVFISVLGAEYLGLNGLFSNILSILSLSELGIGSAISFYLYKPLADKNVERVKSLIRFYKICYRIVGGVILVIGSCLLPILPKLVNFDVNVPVNLYLVYFLYLLNTAGSYLFFAYKQSLVLANQEQYKIEKINIVFTFINCFTDIVVLLIFRNYIIYLAIKFALVISKNLIIAKKIDKEYPFIKDKSVKPLTAGEIKGFLKDVGNISLFRIGSTLFNATDNIIISMLLGTTIVGYYSNYFMIIAQVTTVLAIIVRAFTAGIGNLIVTESKEIQYDIYKQLNFGVYFIVTIFTTCLFQLLNSFIKIWVGSFETNYVLSQSVVFCLCINFYFDNTTQVMNSFRETSGNFKTGRLLQLLGGILNIILSIVLGKKWGLVGIFVATILSKGLITVSPFLMGVSRNVFGKGRFVLLVDYYKKMIVMLILLAIVWFTCIYLHMNGIIYFIIECIIAIAFPTILLCIIYWKTSELKCLVNRVKVLVQK